MTYEWQRPDESELEYRLRRYEEATERGERLLRSDDPAQRELGALALKSAALFAQGVDWSIENALDGDEDQDNG